jgi:hypothetical protein
VDFRGEFSSRIGAIVLIAGFVDSRSDTHKFDREISRECISALRGGIEGPGIRPMHAESVVRDS